MNETEAAAILKEHLLNIVVEKDPTPIRQRTATAPSYTLYVTDAMMLDGHEHEFDRVSEALQILAPALSVGIALSDELPHLKGRDFLKCYSTSRITIEGVHPVIELAKKLIALDVKFPGHAHVIKKALTVPENGTVALIP